MRKRDVVKRGRIIKEWVATHRNRPNRQVLYRMHYMDGQVEITWDQHGPEWDEDNALPPPIRTRDPFEPIGASWFKEVVTPLLLKDIAEDTGVCPVCEREDKP